MVFFLMETIFKGKSLYSFQRLYSKILFSSGSHKLKESRLANWNLFRKEQPGLEYLKPLK